MWSDAPQAALKEAYALLFQQRWAEATTHFESLKSRFPEHPDVWNGLGLLAEQTGQPEAAESCYRKALALNGEEPEYHNNLALLLQAQGQDQAALQHFEQVHHLQPDYRSAYNLGRAYHTLGQVEAAIEQVQKALWLNPQPLILHQWLCELYQENQCLNQGLSWYQQLLRKHSQSAPAAYFLACLYELQGEMEQARTYLQTTLELQPDWELPQQQAIVWNLKTDHGRALKHSRQLYQKSPRPEHLLLLLNALPAPVYPSREAQAENMAEIEVLLDRALQEIHSLPDFRLIGLPFHLAYQNSDDRYWNEKFHTLYRRLIPSLPPRWQNSPPRRKRIGVISRFLFQHAVAFCFGGLFEALSGLEDCELHLFPLYDQHLANDTVSQRLQQMAHAWHPLAMEQPVLLAAQQVQSAQLDLLIYPEIGMDPFTYMLAHSRLAPQQVVLAGHPLTSGLSSMDYFVTSAELEIPGCQAHYSEKWVGLPGLIQYPHPALPERWPSRAQLGLPESSTLYLCPMTLFKIHPDLDLCFAEILRQDRSGKIILFEYLQTDYHLILKQRFEKVMPDVAERILFLPFQSFSGFLKILKQADVVLDTLYFSGGNTSFLAFELGIPIVTLASDKLKARSTWGLYQRMGLTQGLAQNRADYVQKALQLGMERDARHALSQAILARKGLIFEQSDWNRAFVDWCQTLLYQA